VAVFVLRIPVLVVSGGSAGMARRLKTAAVAAFRQGVKRA